VADDEKDTVCATFLRCSADFRYHYYYLFSIFFASYLIRVNCIKVVGFYSQTVRVNLTVNHINVGFCLENCTNID
jgi:hypothetical protein